MNIYGIILAAGEAKRASGYKLSRPVMGKPMLEWVADRAAGSNLKGNIMVTGKERGFADGVAAKYRMDCVYNPDYKMGMSSSLKKGVGSLPEDADGFAVLLGDMPFIRIETINRLIDEFNRNPSTVVPAFKGRRGHPPIFPVTFIKDILRLTGDEGARSIIEERTGGVTYLNTEDRGVVRDIDCFPW
ncbi:MAG: nucleotidyltransferase family protein [Bacillota bacterium]|jgi:molybdenum cofactor cytidylyltransferase|nr:nucleotidyltransferase family protein [Bacillota bacterium]MDD3297900.1 nucleotidyltransferase family protein [Bacillota bacterium]MDD3851913.1 nucleotidyltransferase family protein [Bacillota bacterium]MDD4707703.1 nucleotidyltransferase family protein [Bacillota bacterium]